MKDRQLPLRIRFVEPPPDVAFRLRRGTSELIAPSERTDESLAFDLTIDVAGKLADGSPNLRGPFTHRRPRGRILVVASGTLAGQADSCWTRAALIPLSGITWDLIEQTFADDRAFLQANVPGTARDGGPACATLRLLDGGWVVAAGRLG